jgi:hypothetical protein
LADIGEVMAVDQHLACERQLELSQQPDDGGFS